MEMHPSRDITSSRGDELAGKRMALCLTGSATVIGSIDLARLPIRHGAEVCPVMTQTATGFMGPEPLEWATDTKPVTETTGALAGRRVPTGKMGTAIARRRR